MPEEQEAAPENQDTPQVEPAPQEDTAAEETNVVDYRSRYENLLPDYTRKSQRLAELEAQLEQQPQQEPQYQEDEDYEDDGEYYSPDDLRRLVRQEAEQLLSHREAQRAQQEERVAFVNAEIGRLEKEKGETFSDAEWDYLGRTSEQLVDEHGRPDIERAYEHFSQVIEGRKQKWVSGKKSAGRPASGASAAEVVDLDDSNARAEFIDRVMAQNVDPDE